MNTRFLFHRMAVSGLFLFLLLVVGGAIRVAAAGAAPIAGSPGMRAPSSGSKIHLPIVQRGVSTLQAIVVDHTTTDISKIPDYWIQEAKKFVVHYAHTSHGSQVLSGLEWLESRNPTYNVDISASSTIAIPSDTTALRFYDGNGYGSNNYITPDLYWEGVDGRAHTQSVVGTGLFNFSLWTWCGQSSSYSDAQIQLYLDTLAQLEAANPGTRFIYYTGHTDGSAPGSTYWQNNDLIRQYALNNHKILFDFADIEVYTPDGSGPHYNDGDGNCDWCASYCSTHPTAFSCQSMPDCAHNTSGLLCTLKAQAFWWLMARLAGWNGIP